VMANSEGGDCPFIAAPTRTPQRATRSAALREAVVPRISKLP
jgi:hypothetical protein